MNLTDFIQMTEFSLSFQEAMNPKQTIKEDILIFLQNTKGFEGIQFFGHYTLPLSVIQKFYNEYKINGINYLSVWQSFFLIANQSYDICFKEDMDVVKKYKNDRFVLNNFPKDFIEKAVYFINNAIPYDTYNLKDVYTLPKTKSNSIPRKRPSKNYIYVIKSGKNYKIGITNNPKKRLSMLQNAVITPYKLKMILIKKDSDADDVEKELHNKYSDKRISGEWFALSKEDLKELKTKYNFKNYKSYEYNKEKSDK